MESYKMDIVYCKRTEPAHLRVKFYNTRLDIIPRRLNNARLLNFIGWLPLVYNLYKHMLIIHQQLQAKFFTLAGIHVFHFTVHAVCYGYSYCMDVVIIGRRFR